MRLIDADALKKELQNKNCDPKSDKLYDVDICNDAPTVDAIPIEWLEEKLNYELHILAEHVYGRGSEELCTSIIRVMELWKMERKLYDGR